MFKCIKCQKTFTRRENKLRHEVFCGGQKPYSCTICTKQFYRSDSKKRHREQVHELNINSSNPDDDNHQEVLIYVCYQCKKQFQSCGGLQRHIKSSHRDVRKMIDKSTQTSEILPDEIYPLSIHDDAPALSREEYPVTLEERRRRFLKKFNLLDGAQPSVLD